ncbi:hypothetical protein BDW22DRAFT_1321865 [Trametopsis cervina]|nr:hypothetical protein BDW22DRAFT_1321865 [Trametopsis cervina]
MPLCFPSKNESMSTDPTIREFEKRIATEAKSDQRNLDHAIRDLKNAEKAHQNAIKGADKAQHSVDKAVNKEHKRASDLNKAEHQHEAAISSQQNAEKTLSLKRQHQDRLEKDLEQRRSTLDDFQHRKDVNDQQRELKLSDIHAAAASRAGSRANSINRGPHNGAMNPGAAHDVDGAEGPVGPDTNPVQHNGVAGAAGPNTAA